MAAIAMDQMKITIDRWTGGRRTRRKTKSVEDKVPYGSYQCREEEIDHIQRMVITYHRNADL